MSEHCINLTSHESLGFVNKRVSILWRPVKGAPCNPEAYLLGVHKSIWGIHADVNRDDGVFRVKQPYQPGDVLISDEGVLLHEGYPPIRSMRVIKSVSVKRCQDVTEQEASRSCEPIPVPGCGVDDQWCHGSCKRHGHCTYLAGGRKAFKAMIDARYPKAWDANLWMWRYEVESQQ
jgi:hypothetical protein